jgi:predicted TIM-barrel fold metal-dependent hydrolase
MTTRRSFLAGMPAVAAAGRLVATDAPVPVVDTHLHCFAGPGNKEYPYHKDAPYEPDAATPEHLLKCMAGAGVDYAIVVHPEPYQDDHRYLEHCLAVGKNKLKGTCLYPCFAGDGPHKKFLAELPLIAKKLPIVAVRVHAYNPERLPSFPVLKDPLREIWKLAGELNLAMQLHFEPRYGIAFEPYIKDFKSVRVLIDHLGRPAQSTPREHEVIVRWAKYDHVTMKISAVPSRAAYPHRDPKMAILVASAAFAPDRLMYGGGFGPAATPESYRKERERIAGFLAHLSAADRAKVFGGNAAKYFGFAS